MEKRTAGTGCVTSCCDLTQRAGAVSSHENKGRVAVLEMHYQIIQFRANTIILTHSHRSSMKRRTK